MSAEEDSSSRPAKCTTEEQGHHHSLEAQAPGLEVLLIPIQDPRHFFNAICTSVMFLHSKLSTELKELKGNYSKQNTQVLKSRTHKEL